jgi:hypothetical protein
MDRRAAGHALGCKDAKRTHGSGLPLAKVFIGIVDIGHDMAAGQLHRDLAATVEGHVFEIGPAGLFDQRDQGLVSVLGLAATKGQPARFGLGGLDQIDGSPVGRIGLDPEQELVHRQRRDRLQVRSLIGQFRDMRQQIDVVGAEDQLVRIAGILAGIKERLGARAAALVQHHHRGIDNAVARQRRLDSAGKVVGAAAGARGNDEFDRTPWCPFGDGRCGQRQCGGGQCGAAQMFHDVLLL